MENSDNGRNFLANNIRYLRNACGKTQQQIAELCQKQNTAVANWEKGIRTPDALDLYMLSRYFDVTINDLIEKDLSSYKIEPISFEEDIVQIPVFGTIKAGIPIESQSDIIDFVEIPRAWVRGGKKFFALIISGDSMAPKYQENDVVIFEQNDDTSLYNGKDAAVMINGTESTFKKVLVNEQGIVLQPYNTAYDIMMFSKEKVESLPIKIIGIAVERRTKI